MTNVPLILQFISAIITPFVSVFFAQRFTLRKERKQMALGALKTLIEHVSEFAYMRVAEHCKITADTRAYHQNRYKLQELAGGRVDELAADSTKLQADAMVINLLFGNKSEKLLCLVTSFAESSINLEEPSTEYGNRMDAVVREIYGEIAHLWKSISSHNELIT